MQLTGVQFQPRRLPGRELQVRYQALGLVGGHQPRARFDVHQLGAWCVDDERGLGYTQFIPSAAYAPELSRALVYHAAGRNEWARELLFPQ